MKGLVFKDADILTCVFVCVHLQEVMYTTCMQVSNVTRRGIRSGTGVAAVCEPSRGCWELNSAPLALYLLSHLSSCKEIFLTRF